MTERRSSHLADVGETYGEHFATAGRFGLVMVGCGLACLVHAVFPFLFVNTGSDAVRGLHKQLSARNDRPGWERHPII